MPKADDLSCPATCGRYMYVMYVSLCTSYGMHACLLGMYVCVLVVGSHVCGMWVPWP